MTSRPERNMRPSRLLAALAVLALAASWAPAPARADDGTSLTWDTAAPEPLNRWFGVRFADPQGGRAQEGWLWARKDKMIPDNKNQAGYEVPAGLTDYDLSVPVFTLTKARSEERRITVRLSGREQEVDGVVDFLSVELRPEYRLAVKFNSRQGATDGHMDLVRVGSDFKVRVNADGSNTGTAARVVGGSSDSAQIDGKYHRAVSAAPTRPAAPTQPERPAGPTLPPELTAVERSWLTPSELAEYDAALAAAKGPPVVAANIPALAELHRIMKERSDKRRTDTGTPPLFLSPEDRALLSADDLARYYREYDAKRVGPPPGTDDDLRGVTGTFYAILYPPDDLAAHERAQLSAGELAEFEAELTAARADQPAPTTLTAVSGWRGFVRQKKTDPAKAAQIWPLFVLQPATLAAYGDEAQQAAIKKKMREQGDFRERVNLGQRYYCTGLTITSSIRPDDMRHQRTLDLLRELAANPQQDRVRIDGQAERAVAPNTDQLCQGSLWNRERQEAVLTDDRPRIGSSMKVGDIPAPTAEKKAKPGQYNDIINAGKFGAWAGIIGFFLGGPIGAVLLGVAGMGFAYFMGKIK